jgi:hypothetical protein
VLKKKIIKFKKDERIATLPGSPVTTNMNTIQAASKIPIHFALNGIRK